MLRQSATSGRDRKTVRHSKKILVHSTKVRVFVIPPRNSFHPLGSTGAGKENPDERNQFFLVEVNPPSTAFDGCPRSLFRIGWTKMVNGLALPAWQELKVARHFHGGNSGVS